MKAPLSTEDKEQIRASCADLAEKIIDGMESVRADRNINTDFQVSAWVGRKLVPTGDVEMDMLARHYGMKANYQR